MKHKVVAIVLVVLAAGLVAGGVAAYHTEKGKAWAVHAAEVTRQNTVEQVRKQYVRNEYNRLNEQCHVGQASYDANTVAYKKANARPVCDLPLVQ